MRQSSTAWMAAGAAVLAAQVAVSSHAQAAAPLRLCADPAKPPFSSASDTNGTPGLYVEIGRAVADALDRPMETVWSLSYFGKRNLRATLLAGHCDLAVGLPADNGFMGPAVVFSRPIMSIGYAIAAPKATTLAKFSDLDGKRVAVQFASPPQSLVAEDDRITAATVMDPDEGMRLLAAGKVDAAFVWGPSAGYDNRTVLNDAYDVRPVDGQNMRFDAAIGFARKNTALRDQVDAALPALADKISALSAKYAMPEGPMLRLAAADADQTASTTETAAFRVAEPPTEAIKPDVQQPPATEINEGREIFNGTCAHCHGPDAVQSERRINLRLLQHRYGDDMHEVFHTTVTKGRPAKGMPTWEGVFTEQDFAKIYTFLSTVQDP